MFVSESFTIQLKQSGEGLIMDNFIFYSCIFVSWMICDGISDNYKQLKLFSQLFPKKTLSSES